MRRPEDLVLVLLQRLDPRVHIGGMLLGVVRNAALRRQKYACQLRAQFLFGVVGVAEAIRLIQCGPVQAGWMSGPVSQLMKCGPVISGRIGKRLLRWKVNAVCAATVERLVGLIMMDSRSGVLQNLLASVDYFEWRVLLRLIARSAIHLLGVEDRVNPMNQP